MVEAGEGRLGMFSLINGGSTLCHTIIGQIGSDSFNQLKTDTVIPLPAGYFNFCFQGSYEGHILIFGFELPEDACFALEISTLKIERVCGSSSFLYYPYFSNPPSMSQRRI